MLEQQHEEIDLEVDRERAKTNAEVAEKIHRSENDDRLVKSLLLCALVHGVETLKNMTCVRLAALNHGTIRSRIPGREHQVVAQRLRTWAGVVGEIRVGDEPTNPTVSLQLSGVDTEGIVESAKTFDNIGTRQFKIRQMLFQSLGIPEQDDLFVSHSFLWRGSKRSCDLLFTNVRNLPDESLRSTEDWKLIIDFPFDTEGHSPVEDLDRLDKFKEKNERQRTLIWLPSFFSTRTQAELRPNSSSSTGCCWETTSNSTPSISRCKIARTARLLLQNQQSLIAAAITSGRSGVCHHFDLNRTPGTLDSSYDTCPSRTSSRSSRLSCCSGPLGANLGEALEHLLDQAMFHQFPKHPKFGQEVKLGKDLRQVLEVCQEAARTPDGRVFVEDKSVRLKIRNICNPLELGQMSETHFVLDALWKNHFNRMLAQSGQPHPTARDLQKWTDLPEPRGLLKDGRKTC